MECMPLSRGMPLLFAASLALALSSCMNTPGPMPATPPAVSANWIARENLMRSYEKFDGEKSGRVAFMGGSVTNLKWRQMVMDYLTLRFPGTSFDFVNAGLSGTPAELGAFRMEEDVFTRGPVDLLFLEFAVNGGSIEAMEGIVRHAKALNPDIDIVQIHIAARWFSDDLDKGVIPGTIVDHEKVAEHYGNSSIHLFREIHDRIKEKKFGWDEFAPDGVHPTEFSSTIYADYITKFLEAMWSRGGKATRSSMSELLVKHPWEHGSLLGYQKVSSMTGFETTKDYMPVLNGNLKGPISCIASSTLGSTVSFGFVGTIIGVYTVVGPDSARVEYSIDGSEWAELDTSRDSWYPNEYVRLNFFILSSSLSDSKHTITFRTFEDSTKVFRLVKLMVG